MQLNYFTVSHDIISLFGSSGDVKLSCRAEVAFSGWVVVLFCTVLCEYSWLSENLLVFFFLSGSEETERDKPSFDLFIKKVESLFRLVCVKPLSLKILAYYFKCVVTTQVSSCQRELVPVDELEVCALSVPWVFDTHSFLCLELGISQPLQRASPAFCQQALSDHLLEVGGSCSSRAPWVGCVVPPTAF